MKIAVTRQAKFCVELAELPQCLVRDLGSTLRYVHTGVTCFRLGSKLVIGVRFSSRFSRKRMSLGKALPVCYMLRR